jgi:hypothetical protein
MNMNPNDPLLKSGPERQRALFDAFKTTADKCSVEDVAGAAVNLIINAVRQAHSNRTQAEAHFNELFGRAKSLLLEHYDANGKRRNVFPFTQVIELDRLIDRDQHHKVGQ